MNCHFFIKQTPEHKLEVTQQERNAIKNHNFSVIKGHYALGCFFGVWDGGHNFDSQERFSTILYTSRKNFCFFWPWRQGMLLEAAKILQKREADNREASRDRKLTILGLWIATIALVANIVVKYA